MDIKDHDYSRLIRHKKIAICGIMPPPLGGVSVHIQRVADLFVSQQNKMCFFATEQRMRTFFPFYICKLIGWLIGNRPQTVYYHSTYLSHALSELVILLAMRFFIRYELIIVDHDSRHLNKKKAVQIRLYRWVAERVDQIICIGASTFKSYEDNDVKPKNCSVESAFIAPGRHAATAIKATYPSSLSIFMQEHTPLLLLSAAHLMRIDEKDIYGIDTTIAMLGQLKREYPDVGLIIGLARIGDEGYFSALQKVMREHDVAENIFVLHGNKSIWPLFEQVDVFLRPTLSDGDSISVRESLFFNTPVVASNSVERPDGVYVYDVHDSADYVKNVLRVLQEQIYGNQRKRSNLHEESAY